MYNCRLEVVPEADREKAGKELEQVLLEEFKKGMAAKKMEEEKIIDRAVSTLKDRENELLKPSQREYYESDLTDVYSHMQLVLHTCLSVFKVQKK